MSTDYTVRKPKEFNKINSNDFGELLWWSYYFGITVEKLVVTIQKFGNDARDVRKQVEKI